MAALIREHLPFIRDQVRRRLGTLIRWKAETDDILHEVVAPYLRHGPRYLMKLIPTDDRRILQLREMEEKSLAQAAKSLGITEDAARMRFNRALARRAEVIRDLKGGRIADVLPAVP
jgi:DNA-directed RNA polymerase specialized sigma24 family protein